MRIGSLLLYLPGPGLLGRAIALALVAFMCGLGLLALGANVLVVDIPGTTDPFRWAALPAALPLSA